VPTTPRSSLPRSGARKTFRSRLLLVPFMVAVAIGMLGFPATAAAWDANQFSSTSEKQLFSLHNQARASAGRKALRWDNALLSYARQRSKDMIVNGYFSHNIPPDGHLIFTNLDNGGYCYRTAGENLGWNNYPDDIATAAMHESFMSSSGHRSNILSSKYDVMAVGAYKGPTGKKMWTVLFADKCGSTATAPKPTPKPKPKPKPAPKPAPKPKPVIKVVPTPTPTPTAPAREPNDPEAGEIVVAAADPPPLSAPPSPPGVLRVREQVTGTSIMDALVATIVGFLFGT